MNRFAVILGFAVALGTIASAQSTQTDASGRSGLPAGTTATASTSARGEAYYHFQLARMYEERAELTGHTDDFNRALDEYRNAMHADPSAAYIPQQLASLLFRAGQTGDALRLLQSVIREHPESASAHQLLGQLYIRLLEGSANSGQTNELIQLAINEYQQFTKLEPKDADGHITLGRLYETAGRNSDAEREFKTSLSVDKSSEDAAARLMELYSDEKDFAAARRVFESIPAERRTAKIFGAYGFLLEQQKDYGHAVGAYQQAVAMEPDNIDYHRGLAQSFFYSGQFKSALNEYVLIRDSDPQDVPTLVRLSEIYRQMGQYPKAEAELDRAASLQPESPEIPYYRALLYEAEGKDQRAAAAVRELLQRTARADGNYSEDEQSNRGLFLQKLGALERKSGNYAAALDAFRQMTALGSDNSTRAYLEMAETYHTQHDLARALATANEGLSKYPKDRGLRGEHAQLLSDSGQVDGAIADLHSLLNGSPEDQRVYLLMATIYEHGRRWNDAEAAARKSEQLAGSNDARASAQLVLGGIFDREKRYEAAETEFKQALQLDPNNSEILNNLGYMLADRGVRLQEALTYIKQAVKTDPQNGSYLDSLGWVYFKLNRMDEATDNLRRAADIEHDDPTILDHLAEVYASTGELREAEINWQRALSLWQTNGPGDSDPGDIAKVRKKFEDLRVRIAHMSRQ